MILRNVLDRDIDEAIQAAAMRQAHLGPLDDGELALTAEQKHEAARLYDEFLAAKEALPKPSELSTPKRIEQYVHLVEERNAAERELLGPWAYERVTAARERRNRQIRMAIQEPFIDALGEGFADAPAEWFDER